MRILFALLMALTILLAGCSQGPETTPTTSTTDDTTTSSSGSATETTSTTTGPDPGDGGDDLPPRGATLAADVENGTAPLAVNVTLDALDAANVTGWSLDWGDGNTTEGTQVPSTVNHTFSGGNFTVAATVTYADGEEADASLAITAQAQAPEPLVDAYTASVAVGVPYYGVRDELPSQAEFVWTSYDNDAPWTHGHDITVPEGAARLEATSATLDAVVADPAGAWCATDEPIAPDADVFLFLADGTFVASSGACGTGESLAVDAPAAGDYVLVVWGFAGAQMEIPVTATILFA